MGRVWVVFYGPWFTSMIGAMVRLMARLIGGVGAFLLIFLTGTCWWAYPYTDIGNVELSIARVLVPGLMVGAVVECGLLALLRRYQVMGRAVAGWGWGCMGVVLAVNVWIYLKIW